jgi:hypothetical protein
MAAEIRLGTIAFSANGWAGAFYPKGMKTQDNLNFYSTRFDSVEVDSTFYGCPTVEAVNQDPARIHFLFEDPAQNNSRKGSSRLRCRV